MPIEKIAPPVHRKEAIDEEMYSGTDPDAADQKQLLHLFVRLLDGVCL